MQTRRWFLVLSIPVGLIFLWYALEDQNTKTTERESPKQRRPSADPVRGSNQTTNETVAKTRPASLGSPSEQPDWELAQRLGRLGAVEVRIRDANGKALSGQPVMVMPSRSWLMLSASADRPEQHLERITQAPTQMFPVTDDGGFARIEYLAQNEDLVLVSGHGHWLMSAHAEFRSGTLEEPAQLELSLFPKASLAVQVHDEQGTAIPILDLRVIPDASSGLKARRFKRPAPPREPGAPIVCSSLPAGVPCEVVANILFSHEPRTLRDKVVLTPAKQTSLVLRANP